MPDSVRQQAKDNQVQLYAAGKDYLYQGLVNGWQLTASNLRYSDLPMPALKGPVQMQNAAAAIMALNCINDRLNISESSVVKGLRNAFVPGRFQLVQSRPQVVVDVAHNPQAARALADILKDTPVVGQTYVVIAMLADKAVNEVIEALLPVVDHWFTAGLNVSRGLDDQIMSKAVTEQVADDKLSAQMTVVQACEAARKRAAVEDRIIVMGSFYTVTEAMQFFTD